MSRNGAACWDTHLMTKSDVQVGACVRVITDRWDASAGTVARVESMGHAGVLADWCFTVEWLNRSDHYGRHRHTAANDSSVRQVSIIRFALV